MTQRIFGFRSRVPRRGYAIEEFEPWEGSDIRLASPAERVLWDGIDPTRSDPEADYRTDYPLEERKALFREFSRLDGGEEDILAFANKHGRLGAQRVESSRGGHLKSGEYANEGLERIQAWQEEIESVRHTIAIWDAFSENDFGRLESELEAWVPRDGRNLKPNAWVPESATALESLARSGEDLRDPDTKMNPFVLARFVLWNRVNAELSALTNAEIFWQSNEARFVLQVVPTCLLGAIWLQLALAITGDRTYHHCEECGEWFEVHPEVARSDKRTCSNACRNRLYRKRKNRALELHHRGVPIDDISSELGSDVETVSKWLAETGSGEPRNKRV